MSQFLNIHEYLESERIVVEDGIRKMEPEMQCLFVNKLSRINQALNKYKDGTYFLCSNCSNPIQKERLERYPDKTLCVICQKKFEETRKSIYE